MAHKECELRYQEVVCYTGDVADLKHIEYIALHFISAMNWLRVNKVKNAQNWALCNLMMSAMPHLEIVRNNYDGPIQLFALCARNFYELYIRTLYITKDIKFLNHWLDEAKKDALDVYVAMKKADPENYVMQHEVIEKNIAEIKKGFDDKKMAIPKLVTLSEVARAVGKENQHESMHKIFSKFLHPTSFLVNSDYQAVQSNQHRNMFFMHVQLYAWAVHDNIMKVLGGPKNLDVQHMQD